MALLNVFKKNRLVGKETVKEEKTKKRKGKIKEAPQKNQRKQKSIKGRKASGAKAKTTVGKPEKGAQKIHGILEVPHITEKATDLSKLNQYVFRVSKNANKVQIKMAVEDFYGVRVRRVRVINVPRKKKRLGKTEGFRKGYRKAVVRIQEGQKIEIAI